MLSMSKEVPWYLVRDVLILLVHCCVGQPVCRVDRLSSTFIYDDWSDPIKLPSFCFFLSG